MRRLLLTAAALATVLAVAACSAMHRGKNPYENPFYAKYLNPSNPVDQQILRLVDALRAKGDTPELHNDLGQLLLAKGFAKDAEREFERAVDADPHFYPAWYNLGLVRAGRDDFPGAKRAFQRTIHYKPGHAPALFQLGLMAERRGDSEAAIEYYAKSIRHNRAMLDVHTNPRLLDSKLIDMALIRLYPSEHAQQSMQFHPSSSYMPPVVPEQAAPSPQPKPEQIVPPSAPATDPSQQRPAPAPAAAVVKVPPPSKPTTTAAPAPPERTIPPGRGGTGMVPQPSTAVPPIQPPPATGTQ